LQNLWYPINNFSKVFLCEVINGQNQAVFTSFLGKLAVEPPARTAMEIRDGRHQLANTRARKGSLALCNTQNLFQKLPGRRYG
jgi:hypothetical protein